ncbi:MAG: OB-fold domain-containing protein [Hydrogenophaga sp.]|nr:OB-fold domain-containing protein [Hydrogenophaga sp.]
MEASGDGTVYSFSVLPRAQPPYCIAYVELAEGPIMLSNLLTDDFGSLHIGQAVRVRFTTHAIVGISLSMTTEELPMDVTDEVVVRLLCMTGMRWRNGETEGVKELMVQLLSKSEADCLARQLGRTSGGTNNHDVVGAITARAV